MSSGRIRVPSPTGLDPDEQPEGEPEPAEHHAHLETGRGELPHAGHRTDDQQAEGHDDRVVPGGAEALDRPSAEDDAHRGPAQTEQHRGPLE